MPEDHIVIAFFDNESAACKAAGSLEDWDKSREGINLGACGVIVEKNGEIKEKVGSSWGVHGVWIEAITAVMAAVFAGGVGVVSAATAGGANGEAGSSFFRKAKHLTERDFEFIVEALQAGQGVLLVTCEPEELVDTAEELKALAGEVSAWELPEGTLAETAAAMVIEP